MFVLGMHSRWIHGSVSIPFPTSSMNQRCFDVFGIQILDVRERNSHLYPPAILFPAIQSRSNSCSVCFVTEKHRKISRAMHTPDFKNWRNAGECIRHQNLKNLYNQSMQKCLSKQKTTTRCKPMNTLVELFEPSSQAII